MMKTLSTLAVALAFVGTAALADDNSMSRFGGESLKAFESARTAGPIAPAAPASRQLNATPDNGMSRWNGDSYNAFADATKDEAPFSKVALPKATHQPIERPHITKLSRTPQPTNPFRDDTAG